MRRYASVVFSLAVLAAVAGLPVGAAAQATTPCTFQSDGPFNFDVTPSGKRNSFLSRNVRVVCRSRNIRVTADSVEHWGDEGRIVMLGRVHYVETGRLELWSQALTYTEPDERLIAVRDVKIVQPSGSTLTGQKVEMLRAAPRIRTRQMVKAEFSPTVTLIQVDSVTRRPDTLTVKAGTILMDGEDLLYAITNVDIRRPDITATADSAFLDRAKETIALRRRPIVEGQRGRKFRLTGDAIDAYSKNRKLDRVVARGTGNGTSDNLTLTADTIDMRITNDLLEHAIAWGRSKRAVALSPGQNMSADSLDVIMPGQRLRMVHAIGAAFVESVADSARFRTTEKDWLRGDTIVALWDSLAARDTTRNPRLRNIMAVSSKVEAKAYYHMAPADSAIRVPAISYVMGRRITLQFGDRQVNTVLIRDSVYGVYLEPRADTTTTVAKPPRAEPRPAVLDSPPASRPPAPFDRPVASFPLLALPPRR